jgi:hypothetical protein
MSTSILLLAAQIAGLSQAYSAKRKSSKEIGRNLEQANYFTRIGGELERQELDLKLEEAEIGYYEQALYNADQIRETLASQAAIFGARGQRIGAGSAKAITDSSIGAYGQDTKMLELSRKFTKNNILNRKSLSSINQAASHLGLEQSTKNKKQQLTDQFDQMLINQFSSNQFVSDTQGVYEKGKGMYQNYKLNKSINKIKNPGRANTMRQLKNLK